MKKIISIIVIIVLLPVLFINGVILVNSILKPDEIPSFFGWKPFIVLSGSMETEIYPGDLAVVKEVDLTTLKENDIVAFKSGEIVITHRIVDIINENDETKYITKGDNNNTQDIGYVYPDDIEGKYQFKISKIGNFAMFVQTPVGIVACLSIPILLLLILQVIDSSKEKEYLRNEATKHKEMEKEIEELKRQNEKLKNK